MGLKKVTTHPKAPFKLGSSEKLRSHRWHRNPVPWSFPTLPVGINEGNDFGDFLLIGDLDQRSCSVFIYDAHATYAAESWEISVRHMLDNRPARYQQSYYW